MIRLQKVVFIFAALTAAPAMRAQVEKRDSLYINLEKFAKKRKASKILYNMIFRTKPDYDTLRYSHTVIDKDYSDKFIRKIIINTRDPLGFDSNLQQKPSLKKYEELGNRLHLQTKAFAVRGYLLFKEGERFNKQKLYESERILRATKFIHRVQVVPIPESVTKDSIDIAVNITDSWSLRPSVTAGGKVIGAGVSESNFMGLGHSLLLQYLYDMKEKKNLKLAAYSAKNIYGTYIDASVMALKDYDDNENVFIRADRQFVSPLTRWAGGGGAEYVMRKMRVPQCGKPLEEFPDAIVKAHNMDVWGGYQFPINNKNSKEVNENIGVTAAFQNYNFLELPTQEQDPYQFYRSHRTFLASVGYSQRKFDVRKNIFRYDLPEDIPYGKSFALTGGFMKEGGGQSYPYLGASAGYGVFTSLGYFNYKLQYGTFLKDHKQYLGAFSFDGTYWTRLHDWNYVYARHFISHTYVQGNGRSQSGLDRINLTHPDEFPVYDENFVGKDKLVLRYQLQLMIKKPWKNFNINPYAMVGLGWLSRDNQKLFSSDLNTKFAVGATFFNPYLALTRFQISFVYYPKLPFENTSSFGINQYSNSMFPINTFRIEKPSVVNYGF